MRILIKKNAVPFCTEHIREIREEYIRKAHEEPTREEHFRESCMNDEEPTREEHFREIREE